jgi:hypothetical protein
LKSGKPKIRDLNHTRLQVFASEKQIFWLDVAMDHAQLVTVNQSVENGADNFLSLFFAERLFLADVLKELSITINGNRLLTSPPLSSSITM